MRFIRECLIALSCALFMPGSAQAQSVNNGVTTVLSTADSQNANVLSVQMIQLKAVQTIQSMSFYVTATGGNLILGVYDATGPKGGPGALKASTASFTPIKGWNTAKIVTPVSLAAGNYWMAFLPSSNALGFATYRGLDYCRYYSYTFGALPKTFSASPVDCSPTAWSFYATLTTSTSSAVNGACGSSNGATVSAKPTANLCTTGTASAVGGSGPWSWSCAGSNGGTTATCSDKLASTTKVNGVCGSSNGATVSAKPTANLCTAGTASAVGGSGPWSWSCAGSGGGTTATCSDKVASTPVNGVCGSSNGASLSSAPTANLCTAGAASGVGGAGPWSWSCGGANGGSTATCVATKTASSGSAPTLIQHVASTSNPFPGNGISGNNFKIPLPNPVLAGDALVLAISYPSGNAPSITDNLGNAWPSAACTASGNIVTAIYVLPNSKAGTASKPGAITIGFRSAIQPFQYTISEFNNIATSSPVNGCKQAAGLSPNTSTAVIDPGSFTPTANNDANGGNVIWSYTAVAETSSGSPTTWKAASGFTLLDGDINSTYPGFPHASQWYIQTRQAAIDPTITSTGDTGDSFNSVTVALKVASAGTAVPKGIHINKILHYTFGTANPLILQAPATGNLRVLAFSLAGSISSITDTDTGSSWTIKQNMNNPQAVIAFAPNRGPVPTLKVTVNFYSIGAQTSIRFYDIQGASPSPFDVAASNLPTSCPIGGNTSAAPSITPTTANGLTIAGMPMGTGPVTGVGGPTNAIFDLVSYTGESDFDTMENADAVGHYYNPDLSAENWSWTTASNSGANCQGTEAVHFKSQ